MLKIAPLASAILAVIHPAYAQEQPQQGQTTVLGEIMVTSQKREESLQDVPLSVTAIGNQQITQLHLSDFNDYVQFLPSVSFQTTGPGFGLAYFRGVASGENANHSGPLPTVGMYLDEQPVTTIQGSLDIHMYDIARVEALAGPQGTLYGASSEAGTIRIITNKPDPNKFDAGYDLEFNSVASGDQGYVAEGFVNIPMGDSAAVRLVGWYDYTPGYIDNVAGTRNYPFSGGCISNADGGSPGCTTAPSHAEKNYNDSTTYGARAALKIDLNDSWSIMPTAMGQKVTVNGNYAFDPHIGDLELTHFYPDDSEDKWYQAALTVQGKLGNFDLVYAGAYLKRDDVVNADYSDYSYFYNSSYGSSWVDANGNVLADPSQYINGTDGYWRQSHEIRVSSPQDKRFRFITGLFYQHQNHYIYQNYKINGLGPQASVELWPGSIWLTDQQRIDKDYAVFGEFSFDFVPDKLTATAGFRWYKAENSIKGFFGFNGGYGASTCSASDPGQEPFRGAPCINLNDEVSKDGVVPKVNFTYHIDDGRMVYLTYSEGFRPGGINRNGDFPPYDPDTLTNYEFGWKTVWAGNSVRFNGAVFYEKWNDIQFSFLPPGGSGLTVIKNAGKADIKGIEADLAWAPATGMTVSGGASWIQSELAEDFVDPDDPTSFLAKGSELPITPEFKANLTLRYEFVAGALDSYVQGSGVYNGASWSDFLQSDRDLLGKQPAYTIANFSAGIGKDVWSLELYVNNAFDERARTYTFAQCATSTCGVNPYYVPNMPRTIGLKFGQRF